MHRDKLGIAGTIEGGPSSALIKASHDSTEDPNRENHVQIHFTVVERDTHLECDCVVTSYEWIAKGKMNFTGRGFQGSLIVATNYDCARGKGRYAEYKKIKVPVGVFKSGHMPPQLSVRPDRLTEVVFDDELPLDALSTALKLRGFKLYELTKAVEVSHHGLMWGVPICLTTIEGEKRLVYFDDGLFETIYPVDDDGPMLKAGQAVLAIKL
jgi:hypothetical protein